MQRALRVAAASAHRRGGVFRYPCRRHPVLSRPRKSSFSLAICCSRRASTVDSLDAYRNALKTAPPDRRPPAARSASSQSALRVAEFGLARAEAEKLFKAESARARGDGPLRRRALGVGPVRGGRDASTATRWRRAPDLARGHHGMARSLAARSQLDEAMDEAQAALRLSPRDLEIHHTVGADLRAACTSTRKRPRAYSQLRQPAAEQGPQREGGLVARRDPLPALVRPARAVRDRIPAPTTSSTPSTSGW